MNAPTEWLRYVLLRRGVALIQSNDRGIEITDVNFPIHNPRQNDFTLPIPNEEYENVGSRKPLTLKQRNRNKHKRKEGRKSRKKNLRK